MKISFTGTHGIGKSTLAMWLSEILEIPYVPEYAREYLENGFIIDTPTDFLNFETEIFEKKQECETEILSRGTALISDRSYLDYAVYLKHGLSRFPYDSIKDLTYREQGLTQYFNYFEGECREHNKVYDIIFFVTPFTEFISTEFDYREKNPFATNLIQDLLYNEYRDDIHKGKVIVITEKDLLERKKRIVHILKEKEFIPWNKKYIDDEL